MSDGYQAYTGMSGRDWLLVVAIVLMLGAVLGAAVAAWGLL